MSKELENKALAFKNTIEEMSNGFNTQKSIDTLIDEKRSALNKIDLEVKTRNMSFKDLKNKVGVENVNAGNDIKRKNTVKKIGPVNEVEKGPAIK